MEEVVTRQDYTDNQIIDILEDDGRASNAKIAREVGVSEGTIRRRLRRLVEEDIIKIKAVPDLSKMGYPTTALIGLQTAPGQLDNVADKNQGHGRRALRSHYHGRLRRLRLRGQAFHRRVGHIPPHPDRHHPRCDAHRDLRKPQHQEAHLRPRPLNLRRGCGAFQPTSTISSKLDAQRLGLWCNCDIISAAAPAYGEVEP